MFMSDVWLEGLGLVKFDHFGFIFLVLSQEYKLRSLQNLSLSHHAPLLKYSK